MGHLAFWVGFGFWDTLKLGMLLGMFFGKPCHPCHLWKSDDVK